MNPPLMLGVPYRTPPLFALRLNASFSPVAVCDTPDR